MRPQTLTLDCEALEAFRTSFNFTLGHMLRQMQRMGLENGTLTGKLKISMQQAVDQEGEIHVDLEIAPDVSMKLEYSASMGGEKIRGLKLKFGRDGDPIVGTNQITMDEIAEKGA